MNTNKCLVKNVECKEGFLKNAVTCLLCIALTLLMIKGILLLNLSFEKEKPTDIILAILAITTLFCTFMEYSHHRKREKADVLGQYNERYSRDEHVNSVVNYLACYKDNMIPKDRPCLHDVEMFMRFFEEMEIQIKEDRLDEKYVYDLFSYYAIELGGNEKLRLLLGVESDDYQSNWKNYICFVDRMVRIRKSFKTNEVKTPDNVVFKYVNIETIYNSIINNQCKWNYYNTDLPFDGFENLYEDADSLSIFVQTLLYNSAKVSRLVLDALKALKENEMSGKDIELRGRLRHIVSLFFFGHVIYRNIPIIKTEVQNQFKQFVKNGMFKETDDIQQNFSFMWFLLCMFHDLGYAYEKKLIPSQDDSKSLDKPEGFLPPIYSIENIEKYANYRHCVFGCDDHGIYGGKVFYDEMLKIGNKIAEDEKLKEQFEIDGVKKIYQYAAWVIACHNIFYNSGNGEYTQCYKCMGLSDFIKSKSRCLTLKNNPLLFLFCLADSIEPTKALVSKDGKSDKDICKNLIIGFNEKKNLMKLDLSEITCKEAVDRYRKNIEGLNDWLVDVSNDLTLNIC